MRIAVTFQTKVLAKPFKLLPDVTFFHLFVQSTVDINLLHK